jgi:hypothetical protein
MHYKTNYLHSLFSPSYNTMVKSKKKTDEKLPEKAGRQSTKAEPPKKNEMPIKDSPTKAKEMPKNPYVPSPKSRNNGDKVKEIHKILILEKADGTPFGWAFIGFYDVKEWLKSLCNRDGS